MNGLAIDEKEFLKMSQKEQLTVLYRNTEEIKYKLNSYKIRSMIQYGLIAACLAGEGVLFKLHLGI